MEERKEPDAHLYDDAAALGSDGGAAFGWHFTHIQKRHETGFNPKRSSH